MLLEAMDDFAVTADETVMIGDSLTDMQVRKRTVVAQVSSCMGAGMCTLVSLPRQNVIVRRAFVMFWSCACKVRRAKSINVLYCKRYEHEKMPSA